MGELTAYEAAQRMDECKSSNVTRLIEAAGQVAGFFRVYGIEAIAANPTLRTVASEFLDELMNAVLPLTPD